MKNLQAQITAVNESIRDLEKEMVRTNDEEIYNELLTRKNNLVAAWETLTKVAQIRDNLKSIVE